MRTERLTRTVRREDLFRLRFLGDARMSPDGLAVAYVATSLDTAKERETSAIYLLDLETGNQRQFTSGIACDDQPRWSPDGTRIAFISDRAGAPQVFLIHTAGGEARQLTSIKRGVYSAALWSPDGKRLAFTSGGEGDPRDPSIPYRVTRHIYRFDGMGYVEDAIQDLYFVAAEGGETRRLVEGPCQKLLIGWSPDGTEILFEEMLFPDRHDMGVTLMASDMNGQVRTVLEGYGEMRLPAMWTPDGRIAIVSPPWGARMGSKGDLWVMPRQGGEPECRTSGLAVGIGGSLDSDVPGVSGGGMCPTTDGSSVFASVQERGRVHVYCVSLRGPEEWVKVVDGDRSCIPLDCREGKLLYASSDVNLPGDLFICDLDGRNERRLTWLNEELLRSLALPVVERHSYPSADGTQAEAFLLRPAACQPPYPTILYAHGGPYDAWGHGFNFDAQMLCGAGYAVLMVNHRASTGYGSEFSLAIDRNWGVKDYQDLMAGVDKMIELGLSDPMRLGVCGLSAGGYLTCWTVGQTNRFKAAVAENPVVNWVTMFGVSDLGVWFATMENGGPPHEVPGVYSRQSPITFAHRCRTPTLLIQGEGDFRCPAEQSEQFYAALKANGCVVEMLRLPHSSHLGATAGPIASRRAQNDALLDWMDRWVMGKERDADGTLAAMSS